MGERWERDDRREMGERWERDGRDDGRDDAREMEEMMGEKLASVMALMSELKTGRQHCGTCSGMQGSIFF